MPPPGGNNSDPCPGPDAGVLYKKEIKENLTKGKTLVFSHGFNIHFNQIVPPAGYRRDHGRPERAGPPGQAGVPEGGGRPVAYRRLSGSLRQARDKALAYAKGIGATRAGVLETTFQEETETDLFGEQVVLCGGVTELIRAGFDTLVEAGYQPEIAYFECCHELKLIVDLIYEGGIANMRYSISDTAEYGDITRGRRIITEETRTEMKRILGEIQSGEFAKEWILENMAGRPVYNAVKRRDSEHLIETGGQEAPLHDELDREKGLRRLPVAKEGLVFILPSLFLSFLFCFLGVYALAALCVSSRLFFSLSSSETREVRRERQRGDPLRLPTAG